MSWQSLEHIANGLRLLEDCAIQRSPSRQRTELRHQRPENHDRLRSVNRPRYVKYKWDSVRFEVSNQDLTYIGSRNPSVETRTISTKDGDRN